MLYKVQTKILESKHNGFSLYEDKRLFVPGVLTFFENLVEKQSNKTCQHLVSAHQFLLCMNKTLTK